MKKVLLTICFLLTIVSISYANILSSSVDVTPSGTWVDVGGEINVKSADALGIYVDFDIPVTTTGLQFRLMGLTEKGDSLEYPIDLLKTDSDLTVSDANYIVGIASNISQSFMFQADTKKLIPVIQLQARGLGFVGSTTNNNPNIDVFELIRKD